VGLHELETRPPSSLARGCDLLARCHRTDHRPSSGNQIKTYWSFYDVPAAKTDKPPFDPSKPFTVVVVSDDEKTIAGETLLTFLWIGMTPPFGILVLGAALAWALKGFRQS